MISITTSTFKSRVPPSKPDRRPAETSSYHAFPNTEVNTIFGIVEHYFSTYSDNISISSVTTYKPLNWKSRNFTGSISTRDTQKTTSAPGEFCASATIAMTMENSLTYQLRGENPWACFNGRALKFILLLLLLHDTNEAGKVDYSNRVY